MDCRACKARFRADHLIEDHAKKQGEAIQADGWDNDRMEAYIGEHSVPCPSCGKHDFTSIRKFNMMFKTHQGVTEDNAAEIFLRPETAQGIFVNFKNVVRSTRRKLPIGICQIGKSFRNEITPGNFTFRTREFEQMERSSSANPGRTWNGLNTAQFLPGLAAVPWASGRKGCACATTSRRSCPTIRWPPPTLSTSSPLAGANCGALPTAPTLT